MFSHFQQLDLLEIRSNLEKTYEVHMRKIFSRIYEYIHSQIPAETPDKLQARELSDSLGLGAISISPTEANLIRFMCKLKKPQKIVEIGTLTGLSALYFIESLKDNGQLWTFEKSELHAEKAKQVLAPHINQKRCEIIIGDALEKLPTIENQGPFDVIFIDGNKAAYYDYWLWAKTNIASGGLIFIDNVFLAGAVWGDQTKQNFNEKQINVVKKMTTEIIGSKDFESTFVPTDEGLLIAVKK